MIAAAPASMSLRATMRSSLVYGSTTNPSLTRIFVASIKAAVSGKSVLSSPMTSSLTQFESPASDHERGIVAGAATDEMDHFDFIALTERNTLPLRLRHNRPIAFHRHTVLREFKMLEHLRDIQRVRSLARLTIQPNFNSHCKWMLPRSGWTPIPQLTVHQTADYSDPFALVRT